MPRERLLLLLDLYCKAGGAAAGYAQAGFHVVGVDHEPQPNYPFEFIQGDALRVSKSIGRDFDVIHASPPCQAYSAARTVRGARGRSHPDLVAPTRRVLLDLARPYVIENVPGAPLVAPPGGSLVTLCGYALGLRQYRHRLFESSVRLVAPAHRAHDVPQTKLGRAPQPNEFLQVVGNFAGADRARRDLELPWLTRDELREAIPPRYTRHLGHQLLRFLPTATVSRDGMH